MRSASSAACVPRRRASASSPVSMRISQGLAIARKRAIQYPGACSSVRLVMAVAAGRAALRQHTAKLPAGGIVELHHERLVFREQLLDGELAGRTGGVVLARLHHVLDARPEFAGLARNALL